MLEESVRSRLHGRSPRRVEGEGRALRPAAVLVPLVADPAGHSLLFTKRAPWLKRQPNEISFPGGVIDPEDPSPLAAALRESREEVGLESGDVDVLGEMDEMVTLTGFRVTPFVGAIRGPYPFQPNHEVGELILAPLTSLRDPDTLRIEMRRLPSGAHVELYHYIFEGHDIWGITGRLIKELLLLLP